MVEAQGLTHLHFAVRDLAASKAFYETAFGMEDRGIVEDGMVFLRTSGAADTLTLRQAAANESVASGGGIDHFGFRLRGKADLDDAVAQIEAAGGRVLEREHEPDGSYSIKL